MKGRLRHNHVGKERAGQAAMAQFYPKGIPVQTKGAAS
jgi:hypothetical protein